MKKSRMSNRSQYVPRGLVATLVAAALCCLAGTLDGAISVGPTGVGPLTFDTTPAATEFSTGVLLGTATTFADAATMDTGVAGVTATTITRELPTSGTVPPSTFSGGFRRNTTLNAIQSRPTTDGTNAANVLLATLQNDSGAARSTVIISYDFGIQSPATGELPGFNAYYSLTGLPGSWQVIPELTGSEVAGNKVATLSIAGSWAQGSTLYLLWADDNANGITDPSYTIDNLSVAFHIDPPVITRQPVGTNVLENTRISLSVTATGLGLSYQWNRVQSGPIDPALNPSAATANLVISNATPADAGVYNVTVGNAGGGVISSNATVSVSNDAVPPYFVSAFEDAASPFGWLVKVNEPLCLDELLCGGDADFEFNWHIVNVANPLDELQVSTVVATGTDLYLVTSGPRQPGVRYLIRPEPGFIRDLFQNPMNPSASIEFAPSLRFAQNDANGYTGTKDTELRGAAPDTVQEGAVGVTVDADDGGGISHGLLRFDNIVGNQPGQIPPGSGIVTATLVLQHNVANANGNPVNVHRMLVPWDTSVATYNSFVAGIQADGTEAAIAIDVVIDSTGRTVPFTLRVDVTASVQAWANGQANYGWAFLPTGTDGYRVDTSESTTPPALEVMFTNTPCAAVTIVQQPTATVTVTEPGGFTLSVVASSAGCPGSYQWTKNGVDIPGANSSSYSVAASATGDSGTYRVRVSNAFPSSQTSAASVVTVNADTTGPTLVRAASSNATSVVLTFSEPMGATSAQNTTHYTFTPALAVSSAALSADGRTVTLATAARTLPNAYTLRIQGVTDRAAAANVISPNPTLVAVTTVQIIDGWQTAWLYNTNNLDSTPAWKNRSFTPGADWQTGNGLFGTETSAGVVALFPVAISTPLPPNTNTPPDMITFYFRKDITLPALAAGTTYAINHLIDDGVIFYLDGVEIGRFNMTNTPPVLYADKSVAAIEAAFGSIAFTASAGSHTLAAEVHQGGATTSTDVLFGAQVIALPIASPGIAVSYAGTNAVVTWTADTSWELLGSTNVTGPYAPVAGNPTRVLAAPATQAQQFYRLQYRPIQ